MLQAKSWIPLAGVESAAADRESGKYTFGTKIVLLPFVCGAFMCLPIDDKSDPVRPV